MKLIYEKSAAGRRQQLLEECDVERCKLPEGLQRKSELRLPQLAEVDVERHYSALARRSFGVCDGFYPLGSCTMKYNPQVDEQLASLPGFTGVHPLQPLGTAEGCLEALGLAGEYLCEITGMDAMTFQPAAGAHGEFTGMLMIKAWHRSRGDSARTKIIVPDSAHGTNPASAAMAGFTVVNIPSGEDGCVDLAALRAAVGPDTAGLMLTNPNTVGLFDKNILEITEIVRRAGGLNYYDGANLNAVMGVVRPGDMGFDIVHLNLHKTFATPHGGGGPGSGPVGCKKELADFLPRGVVCRDGDGWKLSDPQHSIGRVRGFYGNFTVVVKALCYILSLGKQGIPQAAKTAVLNANYLMHRLADSYDMAYGGGCMHEFVVSLQRQKKEHDVSAMDIAKLLLDCGIHPPTMYFPLLVHEALMVEPTETESRETLDAVADTFKKVLDDALADPQRAHSAPHTTPVSRPDDVRAAREPVLKYEF